MRQAALPREPAYGKVPWILLPCAGNPFIASAGTSIFGMVAPTKIRPGTVPVWSRSNSGRQKCTSNGR
jgi:hypothetical protein